MDTGWIKGNREDRADYRGPIRGKSQPISAKARETVRYRGRGSSRGPVCGSLDLLGAWLITRPSSSNFHSRMESMRNFVSRSRHDSAHPTPLAYKLYSNRAKSERKREVESKDSRKNVYPRNTLVEMRSFIILQEGEYLER